MTKERRLGRGLEALLGRADALRVDSGPHFPLVGAAPALAGAALAPAAEAESSGATHVRLADVDPNPFQPRKEFSPAELDELVASLRTHGLLQPILVRPVAGRYQLIAGERRCRAAKLCGWHEIAAVVREVEDRELAELAIVENLQRKDLGPLEKAQAFVDYMNRFGCTQEELAARLQVDRSTISNLIRLLELPAQVQAMLALGRLTAGHARALLPLGDERQQEQVCQRVLADALSVRGTEQLVQQMLAAEDQETSVLRLPAAQPKRKSDHLSSLETQFRRALGTKVELRQASGGHGRIVIHFASQEEFNRLRDLLRIEGGNL